MVKTYIRLKFRSKGTKPSEVYKLLLDKNFTPAIGEYDFVYDWSEGKDVKVEEILQVLDTVYDTLSPADVDYEVTTTEPLFHLHECPMLVNGSEDQPPPPKSSKSNTKAPICPECNEPGKFIEQYNKWYCYSCKKYL